MKAHLVKHFDGVWHAGAFVATVCPPIKTTIYYELIGYETLPGDIQLSKNYIYT